MLEFRVITDLDAELGGGLNAAYDAVTEWLTTLGRWFTASRGALGAEVVLWTVSITGTLSP